MVANDYGLMTYLFHPDGHRIAYAHSAGSTPGVVFLHGYRSDMQGGKALALEAHCKAKGVQFTRLDCRGHGQSGGDFLQATVSDWLSDILFVLDEVTSGPQILVGSSMGGHLMLLAALARRERVYGLVGIAAAPDFTEKLMWQQGGHERQEVLQRDGVVYLPSDYSDEPYAITMKLIEDGRKHLLLGAPIALNLPVVLLHGMRDEDVPYSFSLRLAEQLESQQVEVMLRKEADHRFSREEDVALLCEMVDSVLVIASDLKERGNRL